jgi:cytochrome c peroxidase
MKKQVELSWRLVPRASSVLCLTAMLAACGGAEPAQGDRGDIVSNDEAVTTEDGLADAYALFKQNFLSRGFDQRGLSMGFGFHPGLSTEKLPPSIGTGGQPPRGQVFFNFVDQKVSASLQAVPTGPSFDLWFVKNVTGPGRTFRPETGDQFVKIGTFGPDTPGGLCVGAEGCVAIEDLSIGNNINFDLDLVVVTRKNQLPSASRIAVGARGLFEKRFFREKAGKTLDAVTGTVANDFETTDALVGRGAQLFFNETFGGNGRTCGTCHRAEDNLTIDPAFIATLPQSDPLFVAENNSALAQLEDPTILRTRALIRENVDGFDDPTHKFVARSVNHTFSLGLTGSLFTGVGVFPDSPPDHLLGWSGDGAPGRGTLHEFAFGAIVQHFTKDLRRRPGTDFRIPTQEELDALEAFQLFTGRQKHVKIDRVQFRDMGASRGRDLFINNPNSFSQCSTCHVDFNPDDNSNPSFNTGVTGLTPELPPDNGFLDGNFGGAFNVPPIIEAADTAPLFHNNAAADVEAAVAFYVSQTFRTSPVSRFFFFDLNEAQLADIAAFLRVINAAENVRQVRKRAEFVRNHRSSGNTSLLTVAIADTADAIDVLSQKSLNPAAVNQLQQVKTTLNGAKAATDANRASFMDSALMFLDLAKNQLFTANPDNQF